MEKTCTKCNVTYPATLEYFGKEKNGKFGLRSKCKSCRSEERKKYSEENKEKIKKSNKIYLQKTIEKRKKYYLEYPKEKRREHYRQNREKYIEYSKKYHQENYEKNKHDLKERVKRYQKTPRGREVGRIKDNKRRLKIKELPCNFTEIEWAECKIYFKNSCAYCGSSEKLEQDHFIPVSKNGEYAKSNIIPSCKSCNSSKNDNNFFEWYLRQPFYSEKSVRIILKYLNYNENHVQQLALL